MTTTTHLARVLHVAAREFLATATTRGFVIGALFPPLLMAALTVVFPHFIDERASTIRGEVALLDPTHQIFAGLRDGLSPSGIARRLRASAGHASRSSDTAGPFATDDAVQARGVELAQLPRLTVIELSSEANLEREKELLRLNGTEEGSRRLALAVVHPDATVRAQGKDRYGAYDLFVRDKLDDRVELEIRAALREAILSARLRAAGLDRSSTDGLLSMEGARSVALTSLGERATNSILGLVLPASFVLLLFMSIMIGGQGLMTTTIEEKSNRVAEVLLSAISPTQLMAGKVLGQMGAALVILVLYSSLGIVTLGSFALLGLLEWRLLGYLLLFFLLTYALVAAVMAAIGAAVNELREAQPLVMPVVLVLMLPYILWVPLSRDPNSSLSTVLSFLPPVNGFAMLLRMSSATPPPLWQVWLSAVIGAAAAWAALWCAGKIFRIGLLMYGKPPNWLTLLSWIRRA